MMNGSKSHKRNITKSGWNTLISLMSYKADVEILDPYNSTKRYSRCGMVNAPKGAVYKCRGGLRTNRHLNAAINLYLQMEGLSPSPELFEELMMGWSGLTQTGEEADESSNELKRSLRLTNPKS